MKNKENILKLLNQIVDEAQIEDTQHKTKMLQAGKGSKAIGDSWMLFHLEKLKEMIEKS